MLARRIREDLEKQFGPAFEEIVPLLGEMRRRILESLSDEVKRRQYWEEIVTPELIALLKAGKTEIVRKQVEMTCTSLLSE
jgi:precorrin-2 dehydrogenase/sirohydrochlorin ferrochelatase